ncbi:hypothetical protein BFW01_g6195 [Lasiodiplodia theobromae]|uniref:Protein OPI10-like protein n=1 Tax=Lasiodiplodia theobromae TaxID=45133 RepID=A0A5N5DNP9_9PEZI|nr:uncharacterized protein LTHEOB_7952 [Lasiodiplodia theobromae]KAB2579545.1 Protein OPI10-like protein [Lasiodiplodia theobromae]KAF4542270.1 hypothetical protein LTHEOB_7952 [Lasiodiplodia theobromae]KAF9635300.1 hypothetical protein BFW01_g6195 [Lasiodiplodia theobromae]
MFGVIISGRPVLTEPQAISQTQFAFQLPAAPSFNHIVVFLLPGTQLPPDTAASVYVQIPPSPDFRFLGAVANEKQSAIFKVDGLEQIAREAQAIAAAGGPAQIPTVTLGVSIEPVAQVNTAMQARQAEKAAHQNGGSGGSGMELVKAGAAATAATNPEAVKLLAQRIIGNAFNFLASFSGNVGPGGVEVVPLKAFQDWWQKFGKKIEMDPSFLVREDQI